MTREETRAEGRGVGMLRAVIVCCAAFAVVAGAAWTSGGRPATSPLAEPPTLFGGLIPLPPGAWSVSPVGDSFDVNGIPMRVAHFLVDSEPPEVMAFYLEAFAADGLDVDGTAIQEDGGGLVAWDHAKGIQRTVTVFRQGTGSMVFPAVTSLQPAESAEAIARPLPPGPAGARLVSDVVSLDGSRRSRMVSMQTPLSEDMATADLLNRLQLAGYGVTDESASLAGRMIEARDRRGGRVVYTLTGGEDRMTGVSVVMEEM